MQKGIKLFGILNKRKTHSILSWLLLLFFAAGQFVVYAHQHNSKYAANVYSTRHHTADPHQMVQEKCSFCDQMHHAPFDFVQGAAYHTILIPVTRIFVPGQHHYKANSLVHSDGLSPPALA